MNEKKKRNLKEKGITLIALVVTIIILLILAGVTVNLVIGQNGLLQRAQMASNTMANATSNELTQLGQFESDVVTYTDGYISNGRNQQGDGINPVNSSYVGDFGKQVTWPGKTEEDGTWRLFYADTNGKAYLIRDSIGNQTCYNLSSLCSSEISQLGKALNPQYTDWNEKTLSDYNGKEKCVSELLDITKWTTYGSVVPGAIWTIGTPTLEMFLASFNATHDNSTYNKKIDCEVVQGTYTYGYNIGKTTYGGTISSYSTTVDGLGCSTALDQAIYCYGYWWLASPTSYGDGGFFMYVTDYNNGKISYCNGGYSYGLRPVVAVPISSINKSLMLGSI